MGSGLDAGYIGWDGVCWWQMLSTPSPAQLGNVLGAGVQTAVNSFLSFP